MEYGSFVFGVLNLKEWTRAGEKCTSARMVLPQEYPGPMAHCSGLRSHVVSAFDGRISDTIAAWLTLDV